MKRNLWGILGFAAFSVQAGTYTWNGGATGEWSDSVNWLCDGTAATAAPGASDTVDLSAVTSSTLTIASDETATVKQFKAPSDGGSLTLTGGGKLVVTDGLTGCDGGGRWVLDGVSVWRSTKASEWSCNGSLSLPGAGSLVLTNKASLYCLSIVTTDTAPTVEVNAGSTFWLRKPASGIKSLNLVLNGGSLGSYGGDGDSSRFVASGDVHVTLAGAAPVCEFFYKPPKVSGTLTFHYVLPPSPYAQGPVRNAASSYTGDLEPVGGIRVEIDDASPAFQSGETSTYRLFKWDKNLAYGLSSGSFVYSRLRTTKESFSTAFAASATSVYPQYLDVTVDGSFDPANHGVDATFGTPKPTNGKMTFVGNVFDLGVENGQAATSATIKLTYGVSGETTQEVVLGSVTEAGDFEFTLGEELDATATYAYQLSVVNNCTTPSSVTSESGTFSLVCGSVLGKEVSSTSTNGRGTVSGTLAVLGSGETTVTLWLSQDGQAFTAFAEKTVTQEGPFAFDIIYPGEGKWYYRLSSANSYSGQSWSDETAPKDITITDANTYIWTGASGIWTNSANWVCEAGEAGLGYPTSAAAAIFPNDQVVEVSLSTDTTVSELTIGQDNSSVTIRGNGHALVATSQKITGGAAELVFDNVTFSDGKDIWSCGNNLNLGEDSRLVVTNKAKVSFRNSYTGKNLAAVVCDGGLLWIRNPNFGSGLCLELDDGTFEEVDGKLGAQDPATIRFKGTEPKFRGMSIPSETNLRLEFELPVEPYAEAPFGISKSIPNVVSDLTANDGCIKVVIPKDCPARKAKSKGVYSLVDWAKSYNTNYTGINTNAFDFAARGTKIYGGEHFDFTGADSFAEKTDMPQYLRFTMVRVPGLSLIFR